MPNKYSRKQVNKAGEEFLIDEIYQDSERFNRAMDVLSHWRFQHEKPLEKALVILKKDVYSKDKNTIFAKRLKRYASIVEKLRRFPKMKLKNMQDIGGCRAIVPNTKKLYQIVRVLRKRTEFKNSEGKIRFKDYIEKPKDDGYRGYHLVGSFKDENNDSKLIELQLRTELQHDWATALEIVDLFTGQALKSNHGKEEWKEFFKFVSKHFSVMESFHLFRSKSLDEQLSLYSEAVSKDETLDLERKWIMQHESVLGVVKNLEAFAHTLKIADDHIAEKKVDGYVLLKVDTMNASVTSTLFSEAQNKQAESMYLDYEKEAAGSKNIVIALVSTNAVGGIKEAYPNYFADSSDFLRYLVIILKSQGVGRQNIFERILRGSGL